MMNCKFKNGVPLHETLVRNHKNDTNNSSIELQLESVSRSFSFRSATQTIGVDNQIKCEFIDQMKCNILNLIGHLNGKMLPNSTIDFIIADIKNLLNSIFLFIRANFLMSNNDFIETYLE